MKRAVKFTGSGRKRSKLLDKQVVKIATSSNLSKPRDVRRLLFTFSTKDTNNFISLKDSLLFLKIKVVNENGTKLLNGDSISCVNSALSSIIGDAVLKYEYTKTIDESNDTYSWNSYITNTLATSEAEKKSILTSELYVRDTDGHIDTAGPANEGYEARRIRLRNASAKGGLMLSGPINLAMFRQDQPFVNEGTLTLELTLNDENFFLHSTVNKKFTYEVVQAYLQLTYIEPEPSILKTLRAMKPTYYSVEDTQTKLYPIPTGTRTHSVTLTQGVKPKTILAAFTTEKNKMGTLALSPYNLLGYSASKYNVTKIELKTGNRVVECYEPDFPNDDYMRAYIGLFEVLGYMKGDLTPPEISIESYAKGFTFFGFKLNIDDDLQPFNEVGNVTLNVEFEKAPTESLCMVVLSLYDKVIEV